MQIVGADRADIDLDQLLLNGNAKCLTKINACRQSHGKLKIRRFLRGGNGNGYGMRRLLLLIRRNQRFSCRFFCLEIIHRNSAADHTTNEKTPPSRNNTHQQPPCGLLCGLERVSHLHVSNQHRRFFASTPIALNHPLSIMPKGLQNASAKPAPPYTDDIDPP